MLLVDTCVKKCNITAPLSWSGAPSAWFAPAYEPNQAPLSHDLEGKVIEEPQ